MLKNLIIFIVGCFSAYLYIEFPEYHFSTNVSVNIVIAIATCLATAIHYDSIKKQRKDRIWEINKGVLLELAYELAVDIKYTEELIDSLFSREEIKNKPSVLGEKIENVLNVYKPLIDDCLYKDLQNFKDIDKQIIHEVMEEDLDHLKAYERSLKASKELHKNVLKIIEIASGVNH